MILEKLSVRSHLYLSLFLSFLDFWIICCFYFILRIFFHYMWYLSIECIVDQCNEGKFTKTITPTEIKDEQKKCKGVVTLFVSGLRLFFKYFSCWNTLKWYFFYFKKIIFEINTSKRFKTHKKNLRTRFVPLRNCLGTRFAPHSQKIQNFFFIKI
jgi:hypothetical protein